VVIALVAGALVVLLRSPTGPRSTSATFGRGCLWAGVSAVGVGGLGVIVLLALVARSCSNESDPYVVKVVDVNAEGICLKGGPVWVEGCHSRGLIDNLPTSVVIGQCFVLQERHPVTYFIKTTSCP